MSHPRERVLGVALYYKSKGENVPLDVLAEMESYGLMLSDFIVDNKLPIEQKLITVENEKETLYVE